MTENIVIYGRSTLNLLIEESLQQKTMFLVQSLFFEEEFEQLQEVPTCIILATIGFETLEVPTAYSQIPSLHWDIGRNMLTVDDERFKFESICEMVDFVVCVGTSVNYG